MTRKVSLSDEAYEALSWVKRSGESFSDLVLRLHERFEWQSVMELAGAWELSDEEAASLKETIYNVRDGDLADRG